MLKAPVVRGNEAIAEATGFKLVALTVRGSTLPAKDGGWVVASVPEKWAERGNPDWGYLNMTSLIPLLAKDEKRAERYEPRVPHVELLEPDDVLARFEADKPSHVSVDIEDPDEGIDLIGVSWGSDSAYVMDGQHPQAMHVVERILRDSTPIFHNAAYDVPALQTELWLTIRNFEDTAVLAALVDPGIKTGLQAQCLTWVAGTTAWKGLVDFTCGWRKESAKSKTMRALWAEMLARLGRPVPEDAHAWYVFYNGLDACNTYRLWACHNYTLTAQGRRDYYDTLLKPLHPYLIDMGERGLPVDEECRAAHVFALDERIGLAMEVLNPVAATMLRNEAERLAAQVETLELARAAEHEAAGKRVAFSRAKELSSLRTKLKTRQGAVEKGFNLDSTPQRRALLYDYLGLPKLKDRDGKVRTDDDALAELKEKLAAVDGIGKPLLVPRVDRDTCVQVLDAMIDGKKALTWKRNFCISPVIPGKPGMRPRMQTEYSLHRTATGRLASGTNPDYDVKVRKQQLQNVPEALRDIYAADPGYVMVGGDLSNIEWALVQWDAMHVPSATKDRLGIPRDFHRQLLARFLRRELDAHRYLASVRYEKPEAEITTEERKSVKPVTHGRNYLGGAEGIAANCGQPVADIKRAFEAHEAAFLPAGWWEVVLHDADVNRYVETILGWRRTFHGSYIHPPEVPATRIQALAADLCKWILLDLFRTCPEGWEILTTTHDSFLLQVPEADAERAAEWLKSKMEQAVPWLENYAFLADVKVGPNWKVA